MAKYIITYDLHYKSAQAYKAISDKIEFLGQFQNIQDSVFFGTSTKTIEQLETSLKTKTLFPSEQDKLFIGLVEDEKIFPKKSSLKGFREFLKENS